MGMETGTVRVKMLCFRILRAEVHDWCMKCLES
jgi:hypothetical protein